jgi:hypothetical protein
MSGSYLSQEGIFERWSYRHTAFCQKQQTVRPRLHISLLYLLHYTRGNPLSTTHLGISKTSATWFITAREVHPFCLCPRSSTGMTAAFLYWAG